MPIVLRPPFKNKPNPYTSIDGKPFFIARDCAVVAQVLLYLASTRSWHVLLGKRGNSVPDFQGFWGFPCGYLDWDETLYEAVLREVWEETGLILSDLSTSEHVLKSHHLPSDQTESTPMPWKISDTPHKSKKQNISLHFNFLVHWQHSTLPPLTTQYAEVGEAEAAEWVALDKALQLKMAFNHSACLDELLKTKKSQLNSIARLL